MRAHRATTLTLAALLATASLGACGKAEQAEPSVPPAAETSAAAPATTEVAATTAPAAPMTAPTTAAPTFAAPRGTATKLAVANPGGKPFITTAINRYAGPYNGIFEPKSWEVAWWERGRYGAPAQATTSVLAGHVTMDGVPDVFYRLHEAKPGARIMVTYSSGETTEWEVTELISAKKETVASNKTPEGKKVWGSPGLRLITCDAGSGKRPDGHLVGNTVVLAKRVR